MGSNFITTLWNWLVSLDKTLKGLQGFCEPKKRAFDSSLGNCYYGSDFHMCLSVLQYFPLGADLFLDCNKKWKNSLFSF